VKSCCKVRYSQSSVTEDSSLLGCYAVWIDNQNDLPTDGSQRSVDPEDEGTKVLRNVVNSLPVDTAYTSQQVVLSQIISCQQGARFPTTSLKTLRPSVPNRSTEKLQFCYELYFFFVSLVCRTFSPSLRRSHTKLTHLNLASSQFG